MQISSKLFLNGFQRLKATSDRTEKRKTTVHCKFENVALSECVLMLIAAEGVCYELEVMSMCSESGGGMRSKTKKIWKTDKQK